MKKAVVLMSMLLLAAGLVLVSCNNSAYGKKSAPSAAAPAPAAAVEIKKDAVIIRIANNVADDHPQSIVLADFKKTLETKSNGSFKVEIYNNNLLGTAEVYADNLIKGNIQMALPGTTIAQYYPLDAAFSCPFLFRDWDHFTKVAQSEITQRIYQDMPEKIGVRCFGQIPTGFRVVDSRVKVNQFEDLKGLRLRVPNIQVYIAVANGMGTSPISMSLSELYSALEQKAVDACENTYATLYTSMYHEIAPYIIETNHIFNTISFLVNEKFWQGLPDADKKLMQGCIDESLARGWEDAIANETKFKDKMKEEGATIITPDTVFWKKLVDGQEASKQVFFKDYPGTEEFSRLIAEVK
ncbi:hypothetical protein AGMMS49546_35520 [Spirochaetia bacterium]|nr:hypothetical protein AGMMS49546_35520 [Spirochaetia bacterium]